MNKETKFISIKVAFYAMANFLFALIASGINEDDICISKEDDNLIVRIPKDSLYKAVLQNNNKK